MPDPYVPTPDRSMRAALAIRLVGAALALVVAGFCAASGAMLYDMRRDTWNRAVTGQTNLLTALSQDIARNIETFDLSLKAVVDGMAEPKLSGLDPHVQDLILYDRAASAKDLGAILVLDRTGRVIRDSMAESIGADLGDREYFKAHRDDASLGLYISAPFRPRVTGDDEMIGLSRRLRSPDGAFAGIVVGTMRLSYFNALFSHVDIGPSGHITLMRQDGTCLMRAPYSPSVIGTSFAANKNFRSYLGNGMSLFTGTPGSDGVLRMHAFGRVGNLPLLLNVALSEDDVFTAWRSRSVALAVTLGALCSAAGGLWFALMRQMRRTAAAEREASRNEAQYRLLADHAQDVIMRLDGTLRRTYVSPAIHALVGYAPEDLLGLSPQGIVHPDDWPAVLALVAAARGERADVEATYRLRHRRGHHIWVEGRYSRVPDDGGFIVVLRDITQRKAAEERFVALNAELVHFASSDALTGLANRRRFDEVLDETWRHAADEGTSLSLLLVDVDRFKLYNDAYGHPAGDDCLRAIAEALRSVVRGPADLVARYGGEELAVVLPDTDEAGAGEVAELVRAAVEGLARTHPGNGACGGVVTASVGCATVRPGAGQGREPANLVGEADSRLYEAKRAGRNRVVNTFPVAPVVPAQFDEKQRLAVLAAYDACGASDPSVALDTIAAIAARLFGTPIGFVSIVGETETRIAGRHGIDMLSAPRDDTFCAHTIQGDEPLVVQDTQADPRFADNPFTRAGLGFYAGAPLVSPIDGRRLGALCIADSSPRAGLDDRQRVLLAELARIAMDDLERRRTGSERPVATSDVVASEGITAAA